MTIPLKGRPPVDVVVAGGGLAGHCAALAAAEQGATVELFEKTSAHGGSTLLSSGTFAFANTDLQRDVGIEDSEERLALDLFKSGNQCNDPALVDLYVREQGSAFKWLQSQGVIFHPLALSSGMSVPRSHPADPEQLIEMLQQRVRDQPLISCNLNCAVVSLNSRDGNVAGVCLDDNSAVTAKRGVVLATGGFPHNRTLIDKYAPRLASALAVGGVGCDGTGLLMAQSIGAGTVDMEFISGTFGMSLGAGSPILRLAIFRGAIAVNINAARFVDESISYKIIGERCLEQPQGIAFQVFDERIMEQSTIAPTSNDYRDAQARRLVHTAHTVAALAQCVGLEPSHLEATICRYNRDAQRGVDSEFGRHSLGGGHGRIAPIDRAPYYIYPCTTGILGTYCGLRVDTSMRVLNADCRPIRGLYAAGEVVGGFHGSGYMSGTALGKAAIFGRIAGRASVHTLSQVIDPLSVIHA